MTPPLAQVVVPLTESDRALLAGVRLRSAVRSLAKEVGFKRLGDLWGGADEATVSQKVDEKNRHYMKPHELLAAMALDNSGGVLAVLCDELGYERPERKPDPASEAERLRAALRETLSPEIAEVIERKAGL